MCHFSVFIGYYSEILVCVHLNSLRTGHLKKAQFCIEIVLTVGKATANIYPFTMQTFTLCFIEIHKTMTEELMDFL